MLKTIICLLLISFACCQDRFDPSGRRDHSELMKDLDKFREAQKKFLEENTQFNSSFFRNGGANNFNFTLSKDRQDLEERLKDIRKKMPQSWGLKCYNDQDSCVGEGQCENVSDCIPCMNWETRKPGYRCLKSEENTPTP